jgi:putative membrane protein
MRQTRSDKVKYLKNFLKGIAIGVATLIPGVSGGTMAIILGVYDNLIHAISSFFEDWKKNIVILLEIGLGGLVGLVLFSGLLEKAITSYPHMMQFLFIGIIIGGLPVLYKKSTSSDKREMADFLFLAIGFVAVLLLSKEPSSTTAMATSQGIMSMVFLFFGGIVIAVALVLPGISGSFMLLALGLYGITLNAINSFNVPFLIPLGLGVVVGTLGTTKLIEKFLQKYPNKAYMLIMGFVIGSLLPVFPGIPEGFQIVTSAIAFILGFIVIFVLGKKGLAD